MAGHGQGRGHDGGQGRDQEHGQGHGGGMHREDQDGTIGQHRDDVPGSADDSVLRNDDGDGPGRSEDSPGHQKKAAGAQSARDFAPGRQRRA